MKIKVEKPFIVKTICNEFRVYYIEVDGGDVYVHVRSNIFNGCGYKKVHLYDLTYSSQDLVAEAMLELGM